MKQFVICLYHHQKLVKYLWNTENSFDISLNRDDLIDSPNITISFVNDEGILYVVIDRDYTDRVLITEDTVIPVSSSVGIALYEIKDNELKTYECKTGDVFTIGRKGTTIVLENKSVSRCHATLSVKDGFFEIIDDNSLNGTYLNGVRISAKEVTYDDVIDISGYSLTFEPGRIIVSEIPVAYRDHSRLTSNENSLEQIIIKRSPRLRQEIPTGDIKIPDPPSMVSKPEMNWLATFLPAFITVTLAVVMAVVMSSPMMMVYTLPMTVGGLIVSLTNFFKQNKQYKEKTISREEKYNEVITETEATIKEKMNLQKTVMVSDYPESRKCLNIAQTKGAQLWQRRPSDADFAKVRIGTGKTNFNMHLEFSDHGLSLEEDPLRDKGKELYEKYQTINDAPVICDLSSNIRCGVIGEKRALNTFFSNLFVQLCTHYCYSELKIICVCDSTFSKEMSWINKLPHFMDESREYLFVAADKASSSNLLQVFLEVLKQRKAVVTSLGSHKETNIFLPHIVFVIQDQSLLDKTSSISDYLLRENDISSSVVFAAHSLAMLPKECAEIIELEDDSGTLYYAADISEKKSFTIEKLDKSDLVAFSNIMENYICEDENVRNSIPSAYSFFEMYDIKSPKEIDLSKLWAGSDVLNSLSVPIGIGENGKRICLDLHEKGHGPHGLVAGTTGSGKSEFLQSFILSVALNFHPYEVCFLIIDFKGGGMAYQFEKLPHILGSITNISNEEITRSLASIRAELLRRQKLFAENKVNSIEGYIEKYKAGAVSTPIPHLIIIVDEFAELKAEQPEFMKELISASRIGRSLGVHLILATQKPSGQVSDQIWSNSKFQICLKVASLQDSTEVIKSPLAANIKEPGRAYIRVGNDDVFELFQSGYSGEKTDGDTTQLHSLIDLIARYCENNKIKKLAPICLPSLPEIVSYARSDKEDGIAIGIYDDPENQIQKVYKLDIQGKNTIVIGSSFSGKTNLLQCVIRRVAEQFTSKEAWIYILDFASSVLKSFEHLNHVGGVITPMEDEKWENFLKLMNTEIEERRKTFVRLGVSSYASYIDAGYTGIPQVIVIIDNLYAVRELYCEDEDELLPLLQNGPTYGINFLATAYQTGGIGFKYIASFANRLAFYCNDTGEYSSLFGFSSLQLSEINGRCIVEVGKKQLYCQTYLAFEGNREVERTKNIMEFVVLTNKKNPDKAVEIPVIPNKLSREYLMTSYDSYMKALGDIVIGLDYEDVGPYILSLKRTGLIGICANSSNDSIEFVKQIVYSCSERFGEQVELYIADDVNRNLSELAGLICVKGYSSLPSKACEYIKAVEQKLAERYNRLSQGDYAFIDASALEIIILNGDESFGAVDKDNETLSALSDICGKYKTLNVAIVLCGVENSSITYNSPEVLKKLKNNPKWAFFGDLTEMKPADVPFSIIKKYKKKADAGTGYMIEGSTCRKLKFVGNYKQE